MEIFTSKNGEKYEVLERAECEKHGRYISRFCRWAGTYSDGTQSFDAPVSRNCPCCTDDAKSLELYGQLAIPLRFQGKRLEDFVAATDRAKKAKAFFEDYADHADEYIEAGRSIVLTGRPGTGKTHLACALAESVRRAGHTALFTSATKIIRNIRSTWGGAGDEAKVIEDYAAIDLLIIDEVGVQNGTDNERLLLFSVLNDRYERIRPTVLISNLPLKGVQDAIGARAFDRLRENGGMAFEFDWESYRGKASPAVVPVRKNTELKTEEIPDDTVGTHLEPPFGGIPF